MFNKIASENLYDRFAFRNGKLNDRSGWWVNPLLLGCKTLSANRDVTTSSNVYSNFAVPLPHALGE